MTMGWMTDSRTRLSMLHWILGFAIAARDQLRHTHVRFLSTVIEAPEKGSPDF